MEKEPRERRRIKKESLQTSKPLSLSMKEIEIEH